jgi:hypothetical protein
MTGGAPGKKYWLQSLEKTARQSPWLLCIDVTRAQDGFSWCHHLIPLCLAAKPYHVGVIRRGLLIGHAPSHHTV